MHNDIVLGPGFLENLEKHVAPDRVVSYTTIEPPIFGDHTRPGKLIFDFGQSLETFDKEAFREYCEIEQGRYKDQTEPGITFFINGQYVEPTAITSFTQSSGICTLVINTSQLGFTLAATDEIVAIGKFA